jgi:hypothetical protein
LLLNRYSITFGTIAIVVLAWNAYVAAHDDGILEGRVVAADGARVADAEVVLSERTVVSLRPVMSTRSDAEGRFRFSGHDRHAVVLTAEKPGVGQSDRHEVRLYFRNENRVLEEPLVLRPAS